MTTIVDTTESNIIDNNTSEITLDIDFQALVIVKLNENAVKKGINIENLNSLILKKEVISNYGLKEIRSVDDNTVIGEIIDKEMHNFTIKNIL